MPTNYDRFTQEQFDQKLIDLLDAESGASLIMIPGVYEAVSEHFNNDVLKALVEDSEDPGIEEENDIE